MIDEAIFHKVGEGDKEAFSILYTQTKTAVYAYALSIVHNKEDAEDAMQETYLKIRSAAHLYRPQGKPLAWIFTITRNICLMKYRKQKNHSMLSIHEIKEQPDKFNLENEENRMILEGAFKVLSEEECQIVFLKAVAGLKHHEISKSMNIPLPTVISKYNRGLKKMRKHMEGACGSGR